tara:strand:+ start:89380 stop:90699 length:1320 start_codon:yes stop_codon:yes gene_type:complete
MNMMQIDRRILFVDDDPDARRQFARLLGRHGYTVDLASSPTEALEMASAGYAVIATDLHMPVMNGLALITKLQESSPDTAFLLVTGASKLDLSRPSATDSNLVTVIRKPWRQDELCTAVARAFELHNQRACPVSKPDLKILVVEDDSSDAKWVRRSLRDHAYDVLRVARLDNALAEIRGKQFDVIISDLSLPDACGLDAVLKIRDSAPNSALIVLTGIDDQHLAVQGARLGAHEFLVKNQVDDFALRRSIRQAVERCRAERELKKLATTDPLTGLFNRSTFLERLSHCVQRCKRRGRLAVLFIDLDNFKPINDTLGHHAGDQVLCEFAERLKFLVRTHDTVARFGGDEFMVLLEDIEGDEQAFEVCQRILVSLATPFACDSKLVDVSASIGVALYPHEGKDGVDLIHAADRAMYEAKRLGGARWERAPNDDKQDIKNIS